MAVVPLCEAHFPDSAASHPWLVLFYSAKALTSVQRGLLEVLHGASLDLGNVITAASGVRSTSGVSPLQSSSARGWLK
eukprot:CAMPEP_0178459796 /NCGR_PEP_ID=MMETSP0689_2-20121128/48334_1 /TAXON_ID=160604 /ORGANISM="Amphidinium massartii, Strain CS-259" /LENGTH=77 /DNA_ID=CAMNT_0020086323 /DNA_START=284 /DNA_END=517 /DNA_ORIENTATION=-